ncbi:MAG: hypothetical protein CMK32_02435 [Porticoccaceae bacterium]|nr:hypothetical protein [Porticoccaceae bacterium]
MVSIKEQAAEVLIPLQADLTAVSLEKTSEAVSWDPSRRRALRRVDCWDLVSGAGAEASGGVSV